MAEKRKFNSKLNSKGLENFVSEDQAREMCTHQGRSYVFIVQAHAGPKLVAEDASEAVNLIIDTAELVPVAHEERVRTFQRALYLSRPDQYGQEAFEGAAPGERDVESAAADVAALVQTGADGEPVGIWDGTDEQGETCDYPGCTLPAEHDGDHDVEPEDADPAEDDSGSVVQFSGKS